MLTPQQIQESDQIHQRQTSQMLLIDQSSQIVMMTCLLLLQGHQRVAPRKPQKMRIWQGATKDWSGMDLAHQAIHALDVVSIDMCLTMTMRDTSNIQSGFMDSVYTNIQKEHVTFNANTINLIATMSAFGRLVRPACVYRAEMNMTSDTRRYLGNVV